MNPERAHLGRCLQDLVTLEFLPEGIANDKDRTGKFIRALWGVGGGGVGDYT